MDVKSVCVCVRACGEANYFPGRQSSSYTLTIYHICFVACTNRPTAYHSCIMVEKGSAIFFFRFTTIVIAHQNKFQTENCFLLCAREMVLCIKARSVLATKLDVLSLFGFILSEWERARVKNWTACTAAVTLQRVSRISDRTHSHTHTYNL